MADRNPLTRTVTSLSTAPAPSTPAVHGQSLAPSPVIPGSPPSATTRFFPGGANQERGNALATDVPYHDTRAVTKVCQASTAQAPFFSWLEVDKSH